jgi:hypothetical protein
MLVCPKCGTSYHEGARFCRNCRAVLKTGANTQPRILLWISLSSVLIAVLSGVAGFRMGENRGRDSKRQLDLGRKTLSIAQERIRGQSAGIAALQDEVHDLGTELRQKETEANQLRSQVSSTEQTRKQLEQEVTSNQNEVVALQKKMEADHNKPKFGFLVWSGVVFGSKTVEIRTSQPDPRSLSGNLPGTACSVVALDPDKVSVLVAPGPTNNWSRLTLKVRGMGKTTARLIWGLQ